MAPEAPGARCEGAATAPLPPNDDDGAGDRLAVRGAGVVVDDGVNVRGGGGLLPLDAGRCGEVPDLADATDADDEGCWRKTGDAAGASIDPMVLASAASLVRTSAAISPGSAARRDASVARSVDGVAWQGGVARWVRRCKARVTLLPNGLYVACIHVYLLMYMHRICTCTCPCTHAGVVA